MLNVTSALRPLAEISEAPPLLSGERMSAAACGRPRSAGDHLPGRLPQLRVGGEGCAAASRDWISTLSAGGNVTFSRFSVCSARPDWPASYDCTFVPGIMCVPMNTATTRRNQPSTAVLRCRALQPAIRSTIGGLVRVTGACVGCACMRTSFGS